MLDLCPPTEGLWSVELARRLCTTILEFEKQLAVAAGSGPGSATSQFIPSHCRVSYSNFRLESEQAFTKVRLFRSMGSPETLNYEDVMLSGPTQLNNTLASVPTEKPVI